MRKLTDDIAALRPTLFVAVPRVLERIQSGIQAKLAAKPWIMRALVGLAMRWKLARVKAGVPLHKVWAPPVKGFPWYAPSTGGSASCARFSA